MVAVGACMFLFQGCNANPDRLVYDNYALIRPHVSTQEDVASLLGEPDQRLGDKWMYERPDKHLNAFVDFDERGRVTRKQWIDAMGNMWDDSADAAKRPSDPHP